LVFLFGFALVTVLADRLKSFLLHIEAGDEGVPILEAFWSYYGDDVICSHVGLGEQALAEGAAMELACASGGGVGAVLEVGFSYDGIFDGPACPP
jgi:hypothetical protein